MVAIVQMEPCFQLSTLVQREHLTIKRPKHLLHRVSCVHLGTTVKERDVVGQVVYVILDFIVLEDHR